MRKYLLMGAALSLLAAGPAFARVDGGHNDHDKDNKTKPTIPAKPKTIDSLIANAHAFSGSENGGNAAFSGGQTTSATTNNTFVSSKGVMQQNQNAGANSVGQNALALAYVDNPSKNNTYGSGTVVAGASNFGWNGFNFSDQDRGDKLSASTTNSYNFSQGAGQTNQNVGNNSTLQNSTAIADVKNVDSKGTTLNGHGAASTENNGSVGPWNMAFSDYTSASGNIGNSYNHSTGVFSTNQNAGANSVLQNSVAIAAVQPASAKGGTAKLSTMATTDNDGSVQGNMAFSDHSSASGAINGSFDHSKGILSVNQNSGANSLMQNSVSVGEVALKPTSASTLAGAVAKASNWGELNCNVAGAHNGSNGVSMASSFDNSQGVLQASQNAGANSMTQNSVSIGVVR